MAIAPAHSCLHDEQEQMQIMSLTNESLLVENDEFAEDDDDDAGLEKDLKALRAKVAALQEEGDVLPAESWEWAEGVEATARWAAERMAQQEEAIQRELSSSHSHSPGGEEAAALRAEARRVAALRADAEEVAAAARRLMEADLRRLAADAETGSYSYVLTLTHEELAVAARMEFMAAPMEEWMASIAARLTRGAAEFAATPGEEAFVAAMLMEAARAEDARSALASYRAAAAGGSSLPDQMEHDKLPAQAIDPSIYY